MLLSGVAAHPIKKSKMIAITLIHCFFMKPDVSLIIGGSAISPARIKRNDENWGRSVNPIISKKIDTTHQITLAAFFICAPSYFP
jgi:hypothetical protein